jgi:uncharacterized protein
MSNEPPSDDLIRYDVMVQDALIGVVRKVLQDAARVGLPGEHHFYVTFRSQAPGVKLSSRLREKYPEEMTIVLQHQFWDLIVGETTLEVGLSFGGVPERLVVPFDALTGFYDPSVQFGLKFTPDETQADNDAGIEQDMPSVKDELAAITTLEKSTKSRKSKADNKAENKTAESKAGKSSSTDASLTQDSASSEPRSAKTARDKSRPATRDGAEQADGEKPAGGAEVVSLEAFRKKK